MQKIGICGHFADGKNIINGQIVKTKIVTDELRSVYGNEQITLLDTHGWKTNPFKLLLGVISLIRNSEHVIILPAKRGVKVFVPLFAYLNRFFNRKLHYVVIGGWLPDMVQSHPALRKSLQRFSGIYVETHSMIATLNVIGLHNVYFLPNFKPLSIISDSELSSPQTTPFHLCTFSRVMREKGIEDAITAVRSINTRMGQTIFTLDIYGQVEQGYEEQFSQLQKSFPEYIHYKGLVPFDQSVAVLKNYFALLFPTFYEGEGFPGTVLDAFSAGLPVIASDWKYNREIITDHTTGLIFGIGSDALSEMLDTLSNNPDLINRMRPACLIEAHKYNPKIVIRSFISQMNGNSHV
ncbi:glycosyltransferase family 4 protein [Sulfuricurvum sp.]|uniref:glycosyltransferase family 4 protein n=1 Tax=Sulfuricurvum sp. TaxID=2025608 RepID=UPI00260290A2|nr:glycosyltransferase family 4 protein [Sulfuricurvum sp.]MDD2781650.1 glycosyltransferase family 4 protein [Sulfuricurvum sp.]